MELFARKRIVLENSFLHKIANWLPRGVPVSCRDDEPRGSKLAGGRRLGRQTQAAIRARGSAEDGTPGGLQGESSESVSEGCNSWFTQGQKAKCPHCHGIYVLKRNGEMRTHTCVPFMVMDAADLLPSLG